MSRGSAVAVIPATSLYEATGMMTEVLGRFHSGACTQISLFVLVHISQIS